ncbi:MAG: tripartite tricarboxylate transporter substrate-binding protein [Pseudomonadota bacterium]
MAGKGGGADKAVRFLSTLMKSYRPGLPEIKIVNVSGRSGADALKSIQELKGDAYTLMFTLNSFYTAPLNNPDLGVDISKLTPIGRLANDTFVLWVHSDRSDIKSLEDFIKAAKAEGSEWTMSGTGTGGEDNLLTDFLNSQYGLKMTYVARKGGGAVAKDLAEKRADSTVNNPAEQAEFHAAGITKPIVSITPQRLRQYLRTPTLKETGMGFHYFMQRSVVAPEAMPSSARDYYVSLFHDIFKGDEWQGYRNKNSLQGEFITGEELRKFWVSEKEKHARWKMSLELLRP